MWKLSSRDRKKDPDQEYRDRAAAEIMRNIQGTPIIGYHNKDGSLVIPGEYDDGY